MGAWSIEHFDNDAALDWLYDFSMDPSVQVLEDTFNVVVDAADDYIETDDGAAVLAAAEVIAAAKGKKSTAYPEDTEVFSSLRISLELVAKALQAIDIVSRQDNSELKELWQESDEYEDWQKAVSELKERLLM
jgi:Domain of unknown function (DUF4259)